VNSAHLFSSASDLLSMFAPYWWNLKSINFDFKNMDILIMI